MFQSASKCTWTIKSRNNIHNCEGLCTALHSILAENPTKCHIFNALKRSFYKKPPVEDISKHLFVKTNLKVLFCLRDANLLFHHAGFSVHKDKIYSSPLPSFGIETTSYTYIFSCSCEHNMQLYSMKQSPSQCWSRLTSSGLRNSWRFWGQSVVRTVFGEGWEAPGRPLFKPAIFSRETALLPGDKL